MAEGLRRAALAAIETQSFYAGGCPLSGAEVVALYYAIRRDDRNPLAPLGLGYGAWMDPRARYATQVLKRAGLLQYDRAERRWEPILRSPATPRCPNGCPPRSTPLECSRACYPRASRPCLCVCPCHVGDVPDRADDDLDDAPRPR